MEHGSRGFTLFELLVVLVIVSIGVALTVVGVGRGVAGDPTRRFALELARLARAAKVRAMNDGVPARLCLDPGLRRVYVSGEPEAFTRIPEDVHIEAEGVLQNAQGQACVFFYADGSATGARLKVSRDNRVVARLQIDAVTGTLVRYRVGGEPRAQP